MRASIVVLVCVLGSTAAADPSPEDLLPIDIPVATTESNRLARSLVDVCETIKDNESKLNIDTRGTTFSRGALSAWVGPPMTEAAAIKVVADATAAVANEKKAESDLRKRTGAPANDLDEAVRRRTQADAALKAAQDNAARLPAIKTSVGALRDACKAIAGEVPFDDVILASIRELGKAPNAAASDVKRFLIDNFVKPESGVTGLTSLTTGSLESYVIEGLATFVYNRAKAEAFDYLARKLNDLLCSKEREPFFKNMCVAFDDLGSSVTLSAIGSYLAAAARKDLERLPDVLLAYALDEVGPLDPGTKQRACSDTTACEVLVDARLALAFYREVGHGRRMLDVARALHDVDFSRFAGAAPNSVAAIALASQVVDAIMRQDGWQTLPESKTELPCYAIATLLTLDDMRDDWKLDAAWLSAHGGWLFKLGNFVQRAAQLNKRVEDIIQTMERSVDGDDVDKIARGVELRNALGKADLARAASSELALVLDLPIAEFSIGAGDFKAAAEELQKLRKLMHLGELIASGEGASSIAIEVSELFPRLLGSLKPANTDTKWSQLKSALPVLSQLSRAKSADEVVKTLEAAAAPVGSYRIKNEKPLVALTGFVGAGFGSERITDQRTSNAVGVFAPVGIHATIPVRKGELGSVGVLLSIVNLGNLVSQRLDADTDPEPPMANTTTTKVGTEHTDSLVSIFAPGVFVTKSIKGPFDFGFGVQFVPSARNVKATTTTMDANNMPVTTTETDKRSAIQILFFVGVDVTIFPL